MGAEATAEGAKRGEQGLQRLINWGEGENAGVQANIYTRELAA